MKWFFSVCGLVVGIGIAVASCGPQQAFCPTGNPDPTDLTCHANNDASSMAGTSGGGVCDGGSEVICPGTDGLHKCSMAECP